MAPAAGKAPERVLVRATNWVGDAVMTLPAMDALAQALPEARLDVLAKPWVAAVYRGHPAVGKVLTLDANGRHRGPRGRLRLAAGLRGRGYGLAVLFQNAFEAAAIVWLAGIPRRIGYARDGRSPLLTTAVPCPPAVRRVHETSYYLHLLHGAGLVAQEPPPAGVRPVLRLAPADVAWAADFLDRHGLAGRRLLGLAPGAAFGPAKCWPTGRYAKAAAALAADLGGSVLLFGSKGEAVATAEVSRLLGSATPHLDLAGATSLGRALALLARLDLFLTNDSGLMHAAAALGRPTVAVFGSTNPDTTGPLGPLVAVVRKPCSCAPCKKAQCPIDLRCFTSIQPEDVVEAAERLLALAAPEDRHAS